MSFVVIRLRNPLKFTSGYLEFLELDNYKDCTLKTNDGKDFGAHRIILSHASKYLEVSLWNERHNEMMTHFFQRQIENRLDDRDFFIDVDAPAMKEILQLMYKDEIIVPIENIDAIQQHLATLEINFKTEAPKSPAMNPSEERPKKFHGLRF